MATVLIETPFSKPPEGVNVIWRSYLYCRQLPPQSLVFYRTKTKKKPFLILKDGQDDDKIPPVLAKKPQKSQKIG
jgi:hypothetical protein